VLLLLHRLKIPLDRDVIFLAEAGEESSYQVGIDFMVERHWDKIAAEFALAEGGGMSEQDGAVKQVLVTATEKLSRNMKVVAHGVSAHGSVPRADNPLLKLSAALLKLAAWPAPMRLNEVTRAYFSRLATISPPEEAFLYTHLEDPAVVEKIRSRDPRLDALLRTTITPTIEQGGFRDNTIPATAEATLMVRPLPDEDVPALMQRMREVIDDPAVELIPAWGSRPAAPPSGLNTEMFLALERVQKRLFPQGDYTSRHGNRYQRRGAAPGEGCASLWLWELRQLWRAWKRRGHLRSWPRHAGGVSLQCCRGNCRCEIITACESAC
jgi:acetylornithine deacetylase/succinyl-diaminopimelate desuccinylase-like protein